MAASLFLLIRIGPVLEDMFVHLSLTKKSKNVSVVAGGCGTDMMAEEMNLEVRTSGAPQLLTCIIIRDIARPNASLKRGQPPADGGLARILGLSDFRAHFTSSHSFVPRSLRHAANRGCVT